MLQIRNAVPGMVFPGKHTKWTSHSRLGRCEVASLGSPDWNRIEEWLRSMADLQHSLINHNERSISESLQALSVPRQ